MYGVVLVLVSAAGYRHFGDKVSVLCSLPKQGVGAI